VSTFWGELQFNTAWWLTGWEARKLKTPMGHRCTLIKKLIVFPPIGGLSVFNFFWELRTKNKYPVNPVKI
jgi:hypothetical protein